MKTICSQCGTILSETDSFCRICGQKVLPVSPCIPSDENNLEPNVLSGIKAPSPISVSSKDIPAVEEAPVPINPIAADIPTHTSATNTPIEIGMPSPHKNKRFLLIISLIIIIFVVGIGSVSGVFLYKNYQYNQAISLYKAAQYTDAMEVFSALSTFRDADAMVQKCQTQINNQKTYDQALQYYNDARYDEAQKLFASLGSYKDASQKSQECLTQIKNQQSYEAAVKLYKNEKYVEALNTFTALGQYKDAPQKAEECYHAVLMSAAARCYLWGNYGYKLCSLIADTWNDAIYSNYDFDDAIDTLIAAWESENLYDESDKAFEEADTLIKALKNVPDGWDKAYDCLLDLYTVSKGLYDQSKVPTGSYNSYSQDINDRYTELNALNDKLLVLIPDVSSTLKESSSDKSA